MFDSLHIKETSKKYRGTIAAFTDLDTGVTYPAEFSDFINNADGVCIVIGMRGYLDRNDVVCREEFRLPLHRIEILPMPDRQVFDREGTTVIYERSPQRQWQKGLCSNNTRLYNVIKDLSAKFLPRSLFFELAPNRMTIGMSIESIYNLFLGHPANSFLAAISEIKEKNLLSRSFSKSCYLFQIPSKEPEYILFRFEIPLAVYKENSNSFKLLSEVYRQEVLDLINRQDLNSKIEV